MHTDNSPPSRSSSRRPGFLTLITNVNHTATLDPNIGPLSNNTRRYGGDGFGSSTTSLLLPPRSSESSVPRSDTGSDRPSHTRKGMSSRPSEERIHTPQSDMGRTTNSRLDPNSAYGLSAQGSRSEMDLRGPSDHHLRNLSSLSIRRPLPSEKDPSTQSHLRKKKGRLLNGLPLSRLFRTGWNMEEDVSAHHKDMKREQERGIVPMRPGGRRSATADAVLTSSVRPHDPIRTPTPLASMPPGRVDDEDEVIIIAHKTSGLGRKGSIKDMLDRFKSGRTDRRRRVEGEDEGATWDMIDTVDRVVDVPVEVTKEGYAEDEIVPRSPLHTETARQKDLLFVPMSEGSELRDKVKRKPSWRPGGKKEKEMVISESDPQVPDEGIGQPTLVTHNLHVTASFKGLPPAWIEQLRQQGIGQKEMEMIMSGRRQKDSITSMNGVAKNESSEILTSSPARTSPPRIALKDVGNGGAPSTCSPSRGLPVKPEWTPLKPPPRPRRQLSDQQASLSKSPGGAQTARGRLIDRDLLRSPTKDKSAKHLRSTSENLLGSMLNGIQQGHKKSMSCLNNLQAGTHQDVGHTGQVQSPALHLPEPKRPIRFRRRAGTEDSPLLLNLDKPVEASGSSSFPQLVYTPVRSQARSRLSTELREFGAIKLSFETDRSGQSGTDDWADEVLMTLDRHRESLDSGPPEGNPRPSFDSVANVPRSISVETNPYHMYQPTRLHMPPESRQGASTPSGTWGSDRSEIIQSPEELLPLREPLFAAASYARYDYPDDRALDIGLSLPRTPTPPGFEPKGKKLSISPPRRTSSMNRGASIRSFGRAPHDALYVHDRASDDVPASLRYRTISLSPCGDPASSVEEDSFLTPNVSEDHQGFASGLKNSALSETLSFEGPLSTNEDHSLMSLGTIQTAWRATPVSFNVLGTRQDLGLGNFEQERKHKTFLGA